MKKLSKITESIWTDIQKRSSGDDLRKEDEFGNIRDLKPVDMGGSILWADKDFIYEDITLFSFDEVNELIGKSGWRLPTLKEVAELDGHNFYHDSEYIYFDNDKKLSFKKKGCQYIFNGSGEKYGIDDGKVYYGWTSDFYEYSVNDVHVFVIDDFEYSHSPLNRNINDQVTQNKDTFCSVRLVKDK